MKQKALKISGARENNLKDLGLEIPHDSFVVVTGLSGSGKSSLAFDTVYAEGQRRYIETFSPYTRQFFDKVKKPDVDLIENVRPAVALEQRTRITSSRSTVGTMTDINDYLKILWSNLASPVCPECRVRLEAFGPEKLAEKLSVLFAARAESVFLIVAPLGEAQSRSAAEKQIERLRTLGFSRVFNPQTLEVQNLEDKSGLRRSRDGKLLVVLERVRFPGAGKRRLKEAIEQAFVLSEGTCRIIELPGKASGMRAWMRVNNSNGQPNLRAERFEYHDFRNQLACPHAQIRVERPRPALFSFNTPVGACPECRGFGNVLKPDEDLCIPNPSLSIEDKAIQCWSGPAARGEYRRLLKFCEAQGITTSAPWREIPREKQKLILEHKSREYRGVYPWFKRLERKAYKMHVRVFLSRYRGQFPCQACGGSRLKPSALAYELNGKTLPQLWNMSVDELLGWMRSLQAAVSAKENLSGELSDVFQMIITRLECLHDLGLSYLTLDRQARTLSGGETQRVNLARAIGSDLVSTHFVLDEPSVGLHMRDTQRLIEAMQALCRRGNSLLVVEHDLDCIEAADHVIELGPQAGEKGGEIIYNGPAAGWNRDGHQEALQIIRSFRAVRPRPDMKAGTGRLSVGNACANNLKNFNLQIPLERLVCLSGVSGSGKSTLVREVIQRAWDRRRTGHAPEEINRVDGFEQVENLLFIDQSALSKSPRANIATYCGIWDVIRKMFSESEAARVRGLGKSSFSFNVDGGRCPQCKGAGYIREDMQFLSDVYIPCELCAGKRFQAPVLEVRMRERNVDEFLRMSVEKCAEVLSDISAVKTAADTLSLLGLGHLTLGHPLSELSGGEAQRLKLVPFVSESEKSRSLLIFDEPTTGLHWQDVRKLVELLKLLCHKGHSVLCVEHNPIMLMCADWIIDLGPEGGSGGGEVVLCGLPADFLTKQAGQKSYTARCLGEFAEKRAAKAAARERAPEGRPEPVDSLRITGAREHNLKSVDLEIPFDRIVAVTGVSGSGKSSIAKDIIYAEGQRRYLDCLSPYARQFIRELKKPEIDSIRNVRPTICVYQHTFQPSVLSTVGTMSEVYNFLRLLYAKVATQYCPEHPELAITPLSPERIAEEIKSLKTSSVRILAPVIRYRKGAHKSVFARAAASEITEVRVDGSLGKVSRFSEGLEKGKQHSIEFCVARFNPASLELELIEESVRQALGISGSDLIVLCDQEESTFSLERTCPVCKRGFFKPDPEDLSFHSRRGACRHCAGRGTDSRGKLCSHCQGARIGPEGRNLRLKAYGYGSLNIHEVSLFAPPGLLQFLSACRLDTQRTQVAAPILRELKARLEVLSAIGLDYLPLSRDCSAVSGGELQRLRLSAAIGSPLSGVMYIFDEPSAGLHPLDNRRVLGRFADLKDRGNSVLIIEHDLETINSAEWIIELGPGGGRHGGELIYNGAIENFRAHADSATAMALRGAPYSGNGNGAGRTEAPVLSIKGAQKNNLKDFSLDLPLNRLITVAGVSGAGKSSLVHGVISEIICSTKGPACRWQSGTAVIESDLPIERVLSVDQSPIGRNIRSTPASYLGIWDEIRKLYAATVEARSRGWSAGFFSYNTGKGRCQICKGQGQIKLEMSFLAEAWEQCESCGAKRYGEDADSVHYLDLSISEVLNLTFEEARQHFVNHRKIHQVLSRACELGLGYLTLGQNSGTLSGGESQRLKLAEELGATRRGHTFYILDEPTTGLHKADVAKLLKVLRALVEQGNSVIVIEHEPEVVLHSDWVVELGPGPGEAGGRVIYNGYPAGLYKAKTPWAAVLER